MAEKRKFLICYDIMDDKRLRRVHKLLSDTGMAVQYSVFEAELSNAELESLKQKILSYIDSTEDKITLYRLFKANPKIDLAISNDQQLIYI